MTKQMDKPYFTGIDIGSTTTKVVLQDGEDSIVFSRYCRHQGRTVETTREIFKDVFRELGDVELDLAVTGSAGMGVAEFFGLPFVQEVVAAAGFVEKFFPEVRTFIEIGGEDSKIIFFDDSGRPDIRMNGSCAGGTGAFIDQMAVLLGVDVSELDAMAARSTNVYPIASRCGVFAKTDIQALLSRRVSREDVVASIFHSVALQVITTLSRGRDMERKILMGGGPLTFCPNLRKVFAHLLCIADPDELIVPDHAELIPAMGAALVRDGEPSRGRVSSFLSLAAGDIHRADGGAVKRIPPLFAGKEEFVRWKKKHGLNPNFGVDLAEAKGKALFLGVDSGSTTTKLVLIDGNGKLVLSYYAPNNGDPVETVKAGLNEFREKFASAGFTPRVARTAATGYGESLIRAAFGLDDGVVETMAHYRAARHIEPNVSFILDIGGQDMKAISVQDNAVTEIQVNEACSSGCGSFIETFARSMGYSVQEFSEIACMSRSPFDLGTRCTVFMNSRVKQALREGATIADISAGLAYSVVRNALYKVLKLKNVNTLGDKIVAQGGTFRNPAVLRALEVLLGKEVIRPEIAELMGAYGAALTALAEHRKRIVKPLIPQRVAPNGQEPSVEPQVTDGFSFEKLAREGKFSKREIRCKGCENRCQVLKLTFDNGNHFYTGNRCERRFSSNPDRRSKGKNLIDSQIKLLFERNREPEGNPILTYGIPRCLNMYEDFPFWCAFLTTCGFRVVLSSASNFKLYEKGSPTVMSENICFPAKLAHGHVFDLAEKNVDRIFYPTVVYEQEEFANALNSYNCPVVTGYPDLLKSAVNPQQKFKIPLDKPAISFKDLPLLKAQLYLFFRQFGINYRTVSEGVEKGAEAQSSYKTKLRSMAKTLLDKSDAEGRTTVVLCGRPYHVDPLINHGIPDMLAELGVDVISETALPLNPDGVRLEGVNVLTQWSYTNRLYAAARWITGRANAQMVQLTSFGCGPDAISADEVKEILRRGGKIHTLIKMDEIANLGAARIRLRSMLDALAEKNGETKAAVAVATRRGPSIGKGGRKKILIAPYFSPLYSPLIPSAFRPFGYRVEVLPPQDKASVEWGLKTVNNDMCYPSILVAGDIIKAFRSGRYNPKETAIIMTQTGGQCRASSYVSLIKKVQAASGLDDVAIVVLSEKGLDPPSALKIDMAGLIKRLGLGIIFADSLARLYLATMVREKTPGAAKSLHARYLSEMEAGIENADYHYLIGLLKRAVADFNRVEMSNRPVPRIGIVGEIFVKYNFFSNGDIIDWLTAQGVEAVLPPIQNFFAQRFINESYDQEAYFKRSLADRIKYRLLEIYSNYHLGQIEQVMQGFRHYRKAHDLRRLASMTGEIVSLANQFGEGWLLTAEMIAMINEGIGNIVCLQPFGCIANHITGRGMEKILKEMFPHLNLLSLDMDAGTSEVNIMNRLHFIVTAARKQASCNLETPPAPKAAHRFAILETWPRDLDVFRVSTSLEIEKWRAWAANLGLWDKARHMRRRVGL